MTLLEEQSVNRRVRQQGVPVALLKRAELLEPSDRRLVEAVLIQSMPVNQIARLFGIPGGTLSRRLRRVYQRLHDPLVIALVDHADNLLPEIRQIAIEHFLQGKSTRQIADLHQIDRRTVQNALTFTKGWHRGVDTRKKL